MEVTPFVEKIFKKTPGLDLVVAIVTGLTVPFIVDKDFMEEWGLVMVPAIWIIAVVLSRVSGELDDYLFDPLYGAVKRKANWYSPSSLVRRILFPVTLLIDLYRKSKELDDKRRAAVLNLKIPPQNSEFEPSQCEGIYTTATKIFEGREEWEHEIKARLEYSKAARVFIFPLLFQLVWEFLRILTRQRLPYLIPLRAEHAPVRMLVAMFQNPIARYLIPAITIFIVIQITAFLYLYLRIVHMSNLFDLVIKSRVFRFMADCETNGFNVQRTMLNVGSVIVPQCELSIFQTRILCGGNDSDLKKELEKINLCIKVKCAKNMRKMRKAVRKGDANVFLIISGSIKFRPTRLTAANPDLQCEAVNRDTLKLKLDAIASGNMSGRARPILFVLQTDPPV
jgi:hypothetical protein